MCIVLLGIATFLSLLRIPYVRFDGKMSAKRRQEAIARFSVPIEAHSAMPSFNQSNSQAPASTQRARRARSSRSVLPDSSIDDGADGDYVVDDEQDDDDDFVDDDDVAARRTQSKKGKGKAKAKAKGRVRESSGASSELPPSRPEFNGVNPRVMLISLKAGALGLNLTVANNVYL